MMRILLLLIFGFFAFGLNAQEDLSEEDLAQERSLIEAHKSILLEKYDDAMKVLDKMYQDDRENPAVLWAISRVHLGRKDLDLAERSIKEALKFDDSNKYYLEQLVEVLKRTRDLGSLASTYEKLYRIDPDNEEYAFEWVRYLDQSKDYKRAIKALESMEKRELDPRISYRKARIWEKSGAPKRAEREYKKLIASEPGNIRYYHLLANHYQAQRNPSGAMEVYKEILKIDPEDSRASLALANQLRSSGKDAMYLQSIRKVIESPSIGIDVKVKEILPFVQKLTTSRDSEVESILIDYSNRIVGLHPEEAKAYALMADMYNLTDQRDLAIAAYEGALQRDQTVYSVWEQYLYLIADKKDYKTLGKEAEKALDYFPNRGRLFYFSALSLQAREELDDATSELVMAQMMVGKDVVLRFDIAKLKGRILRDLGNADKAITSYEEALTINSNDADLLSDFAIALADQGNDLTRAAELVDKALSQDQGYLPAIVAASWVEAKKGDTASAISRLQPKAEGSSDPYTLEAFGDILFMAERTDDALQYWQRALDILGQSDRLSRKIKDKKITTSGL